MRLVFPLLLVLWAVLMSSSCEDEIAPSRFEDSVSEVFQVSMPDSVLVNNLFQISMKHYGSDGCAEYGRTKKTLVDSTLSLIVYQQKDPNRVFTQAIKTINTTINYSFLIPGKKYIRFNEVNHVLDSVYVK